MKDFSDYIIRLYQQIGTMKILTHETYLVLAKSADSERLLQSDMSLHCLPLLEPSRAICSTVMVIILSILVFRMFRV